MTLGLSIVACDASGISEVTGHRQEGLIFRTGLRWALRHPEEMRRMGDAARLRQREFTEKQMIEGTLAMEKAKREIPLS